MIGLTYVLFCLLRQLDKGENFFPIKKWDGFRDCQKEFVKKKKVKFISLS